MVHNEILLLGGTYCSAFPSPHQDRPAGEDAMCWESHCRHGSEVHYAATKLVLSTDWSQVTTVGLTTRVFSFLFLKQETPVLC